MVETAIYPSPEEIFQLPPYELPEQQETDKSLTRLEKLSRNLWTFFDKNEDFLVRQKLDGLDESVTVTLEKIEAVHSLEPGSLLSRFAEQLLYSRLLLPHFVEANARLARGSSENRRRDLDTAMRWRGSASWLIYAAQRLEMGGKPFNQHFLEKIEANCRNDRALFLSTVTDLKGMVFAMKVMHQYHGLECAVAPISFDRRGADQLVRRENSDNIILLQLKSSQGRNNKSGFPLEIMEPGMYQMAYGMTRQEELTDSNLRSLISGLKNDYRWKDENIVPAWGMVDSLSDFDMVTFTSPLFSRSPEKLWAVDEALQDFIE